LSFINYHNGEAVSFLEPSRKVLQGIIVTHNILVVWEQQKDHCHVVDTTLRESHHKAKAWIGTPSCPMP